MNRKMIKEEAGRLYERASCLLAKGYGGNLLTDFFVRGALWRINTVWHDFEDEIPDKGRPVLVEAKHGNGKFFLLMTLQGDEEKEDVARCRRWAYIEDLIPDMTEEER